MNTAVVEPPDESDADIILRSSDSVEFRTHKCILAIASPVFRSFFRTQQSQDMMVQSGNSNWKDGLLVLCLPEDQHALQLLLGAISSIPIIFPSSFRQALSAIEGAENYKMEDASRKLRELIQAHGPYSVIDPDKALRTYGQACRYRLEKRALAAAAVTLESGKKLDEYGPELRYVSGNALSELLEYRRQVVATVCAFLRDAESTLVEGLNLHFPGLRTCERADLPKSDLCDSPLPRWMIMHWTITASRIEAGELHPTTESAVNHLAIYDVLRAHKESTILDQGGSGKKKAPNTSTSCTFCTGPAVDVITRFCKWIESQVRARIEEVKLDFEKASDTRVVDDED